MLVAFACLRLFESIETPGHFFARVENSKNEKTFLQKNQHKNVFLGHRTHSYKQAGKAAKRHPHPHPASVSAP